MRDSSSSALGWPIHVNAIMFLISVVILYLGLPQTLSPFDTVLDFIPRWLLLLPLSLLVFLKFNRINVIAIAVLISVNTLFVLDYQIPLQSPQLSENKGYSTTTVISYNLGASDAVAQNAYDVFDMNLADIMMLQEAAVTPLTINQPEYAYLHCKKPLCAVSRQPLKYVEGFNRRELGGWGQVVSIYQWGEGDNSHYIANVHLQTPRHAIQHLAAAPVSNWSSFLGMLEQRSAESIIVSDMLAKYRPLIVAGDFNLTQQSQAYRRDWSVYKNAFAEAGTGLGYTKSVAFMGARIDHVIFSESYTVNHTQVLPKGGSDHAPVLAEISYMNP